MLGAYLRKSNARRSLREVRLETGARESQLNFYLKVGSCSICLRIWSFDECVLERVLFECLAIRSKGSLKLYGVKYALMSLGENRTLSWWIYRGEKRSGWAFTGPIRRID